MFLQIDKRWTADDDGKKLGGHINDGEYVMCKKIWEVFDMKNMGNYHNQYLKKDILLLADVFEKFTDTCLKFMGLILVIFLVLLDWAGMWC